jgi:hypothetical protein
MGDDGGSTNLWNVSLLQQSYTAPWKMMEAVRPSETFVYVSETTQPYGLWWRQYEPLKFRSTSTILYDAVDEDGGSMGLWNVRLLQRDYTALYPRRLSCSYFAVVRTWNLAICRMASLLSFRHTGLDHTPSQLSHQWVWPRNGSLAWTLRGTRQILSFNHFTCYKASWSSIA